MFVVMAFVKVSSGSEKDLADRMRAFRDVLRSKQGLVKTAVLSEERDNTLVGLSMWDTREAYDRAMASIQSQPSSQPEEGRVPPSMRWFTEI